MMNFTRASIASLCLCLFAFAAPAQAQFYEDSIGTASVGDYVVQDDFGGAYYLGNDGGTYLLFQKMVGDGTGYTASYQRLGLRIKLWDAGDSHFWGEGHVIITDQSRIGINTGGGYRFLLDGAVIGVNGWYDNFQTDRNNTYSQATFGVEYLSQAFDVRANGYFPFGDTENFVAVADPGTVPVFVQNQIAFLGTAFEEQAMKGFDAEAGTSLFAIPWIRAYAGGYYYSSDDGEDAPGLRGRIEAAVSNDLSLNFMVSNDRVFDTNYNLGIEYRFSGGIAAPTLAPFHGPNRKYAQVRRQWPVATRIAEVDALLTSINPRTHLPYEVVHVDNTNPQPGDGTFENPFNELPDSASGADMILVYTGVGSTVGNITLEPFQRLLGEGKEHFFLDGPRGLTLLPESFARTGPAPILVPTDTSENLITLASMTEVNNFTLLADNTTAIGGMNINGFHVEMINGRAENGIQIINASGQGVIRNFGMPVNPAMPADGPFESTDTGVFVSNMSGGPLNLDIDNVLLTGGNVGMHIAATGGQVVSDINGFRGNDHSDAGLILSSSAGRHDTTVYNAFVLDSMGTTGQGIVLDVSAGGVMTADMDWIGAAGNDDLFTVNVSNGFLDATVTDAAFDDSVTGHGVKFSLDNARGSTAITRLFARRNAIDGLNAVATGAATDFSIAVMDSSLYANGDDAFDTSVSGGADLDFFVDPTLAVLNTGGSGYEFDVSGAGSVLFATLIDTDLSQNGLHAVDGIVSDNASANLFLLRSNGTDSGDNGLNLNVETGGVLFGSFVDGSFSRSGGNGIDVTLTDGSTANLTFNNTPAASNVEHGLLFDVSGGMLGPSDLTINVMNGDFSNNPIANVRGSATGPGSIASLNFANTSASGMAAMGGVVLDATAGGIINTNWTNGAISLTGGNGITATVDGPGSQIRMNLNFLNIQSNAGDGIDGTLTTGGPGSVLDIRLANTGISQNVGNGVDLSITGAGATSRVSFDNTLVFDNVGDGFEFDVLGGSQLLATGSAGSRFRTNSGRAWHGTIDGAGSWASLVFNGVAGELSGLEGGRFDVTAGGRFDLNLTNVDVFSNQFDGLATTVDGVGSRAGFFFDNARIRRNGLSLSGDGFHVVATNGATVYSLMENSLISLNRENGIRFDVLSGSFVDSDYANVDSVSNGSNGLLFNVMTGGLFTAAAEGGSFSNNATTFPASGVSGNVRGNGSVAYTRFDGTSADNNGRFGFDLLVDMGGQLTTRLNTTGSNGTLSASNNGFGGVRFRALNGGPTVGNILMSGPNEFNDNGGTGVDIDGVDVLQLVAGFSGSAMNNGGDGVNIFMDNVTRAAIAISGDDGIVSGNAGDGIDITLIDTDLNPTLVGLDLVAPMVIDDITIDGNAGHGLVVQAMNSDLTNGIISAVTSSNNMGDGILVALTDSTADNLQIIDNSASDNLLNGVNIELVRTPIDNLQIDGNGTLSGGMTNVGLTFFIDGQTLTEPYSIVNSSDPGIDMTGFSFDVSTSVANAIFNTVSGAATPFAPVAGTDVTTGLTNVLGTPVPPYPAGLVPDFSQLLTMDFSDFNAGETFIWSIDTDLTPGGDEAVFGNELIGSTVVVNFSNGVQLTGALMAVTGNPDASIFVATGSSGIPGAVGNNGQNGIRLFADNSALTNLSMQDNLATDNGGAGVLIDTENGSDVTTATLSSNTLTMNGNGGLVMDFDDSSLTDATISDSTITGNTGNGVLLRFDNSPVTNLVIEDNPDIDQNSLNGISLEMTNSNITGLTIDNNGMGGVVPPPSGGFDIQLNLAPGLTPTQIAAFQSAEARWESIITGDIADIGLIDDVLIDASAVAIDGSGGILGQAGPTGLRGGSFLPFQGIMQFDSADLDQLEMSGQLEDVILHEMAHVLGFGTIWDNLGLLIDPVSMGGTDPRFAGAQATAEYNTRFAAMDPNVPVEDMFGPGTADSHWRDSIFTNELMTGIINAGANPLSRITIAQFADLGYTVDMGQADAYLVAPPSPPSGPSVELAHNLPETVVDIASAMSSDIPSLQIGNAGYAALAAIQQNGLNGINIELVNSDLTGGVISNNLIAGHSGGNGVNMVNPTTTGTPIELDFEGNTITGNLGGRGVHITLAQPDLDSSFTDNDISDNGSQGVNIELAGGVTADLDFVGNEISGNGSEGVNLAAADTSTLNLQDFSGNIVGSNGSVGLHVSVADNTVALLNVGITGDVNGTNDIAGNADAGVGVELSGNAIAAMTLQHTTMRNSVAGSLAGFNGSGLQVRLDDNSLFTADIDGDPTLPFMPSDLGAPDSSTVVFSSNAGDGANFYLDGSALLTGVSIVNATVFANADDGIEVMREGMGEVDGFLVETNSITANAGDGIFLNARNALLVDDYVISQNIISSNLAHGVHILTEADGQIHADIAFNEIRANTGSGIFAEGRENDPTDQEAVAGDWVGNTIANNGAYGVNVIAEHGTFDALNIGLDGTDGFGRGLGNVIEDNALDGIQIGGGGFVGITNNTIDGNGTAATDGDDSGIDIDTPGGFGLAMVNNNTITNNAGEGMQITNQGELTGPGSNILIVTADNNTITGNGGDGVEILTSGNNEGADGRQSTDIQITNSTISMNGGRGLELLNRGDGDVGNSASVSIDNTDFNLNMLEAVYVVNTADLAQGLDSNGTFTSGGNVLNNPILDFSLTNSAITNNGTGSSLSGTGLLVYVGTSGAVEDHTDPGGFVSNGVGGLTGRGGVLGNVSGNTFGGNFGVDVLFESFTSTVDPTTGTTWTDMDFDATGYQSDPLARFDLTFIGNTGDAADVTRFGAFYDNADPVFKSRDVDQTDPGPFDAGGARRRNAQRLAFRGMLPPTGPDADADSFLYPGMSNLSTFRAAVGSSTAGFGLGDSFGTTVAFPGAIFGELPFGWGSF